MPVGNTAATCFSTLDRDDFHRVAKSVVHVVVHVAPCPSSSIAQPTWLSSFAFGVLGPRIGTDFKANMTKLVTNISTLSHGAQAYMYPRGFIAIIEQVIVATL